ncbi:MAG: ubiquinone biosynthesis regulatory protein kinase UbiB [Gammaproteobacteria bacterium]|nr:ubiquinone biosynthesis regulatory protein kinase UbiB [Gammaproteobacteria bacterium]
MFKLIRILFRILQVLHIIGKHRLDTFLPNQTVFLPLKIMLRLIPSAWFKQSPSDSEEAIKNTFVELGPVFIKLGQMLSTRHDLFDDHITEQLVALQDNVPAFDAQQARAIIEKELKANIAELFTTFNMTPLASASIAQVHEATLPSGEEVVVKVVRPDIEKTIQRDFAVLETLSGWLEFIWPESQRLYVNRIAKDYRQIMLAELDLRREASNTVRFRRDFKDIDLLYVPDVCMDYCTRNVMVMEKIHGIPVSDVEAMKAKGVDIAKLAERGVTVFFTQVFKNNFFHADMHPGNVFVDISDPQDPKYISLDHAIVGSLSKQDQSFIARQIMAFLLGDFYLLTENFIESQWLPPTTPVQEFAMAIQSIAEPIMDKPLDQINLAPEMLRVYQIFRHYRLEVKPQFVLLEKTVLHIEGLGRKLYPSLDIWSLGQPMMEKWMNEQLGPKAAWNGIKQDLPRLMQEIPRLPLLVTDALQEIKQQSKLQKSLLEETKLHHKKIERKRSLDTVSLTASAVLFSIALLTAFGSPTQLPLEQIPSRSWLLGGVATALLLTRFISDRRPS